MSIFSGLSLENLKIAVDAAKHSPKAVAAIGFAGHMIAHHVGEFYARIEEEDERARREEEKEEQAAHAAAQEEEKRNEEKGRTQ